RFASKRPIPERMSVELRNNGDGTVTITGQVPGGNAVTLHSTFQQPAHAQGSELAVFALGPRFIPDDLTAFDAVEDIVMVGYPSGLWDSTNNYPLVRRGITASHPGIDFEGKPQIAIDMACFEGSSGSPVLLPYDPSRAKR